MDGIILSNPPALLGRARKKWSHREDCAELFGSQKAKSDDLVSLVSDVDIKTVPVRLFDQQTLRAIGGQNHNCRRWNRAESGRSR
jgi:hypothetical protein